MPACLVCVKGGEVGKRYNLNRSQLVIGRSAKADLHLAIDGVSRAHCQVLSGDGAYIVRDLGSKHGTRVNDEDIDEQVLRNGDQIKVGGVVFAIVIADDLDAAYTSLMATFTLE